MKSRLAEVAKHAGVSEATVSRVLHGKPGVSGATRDTVLTALDVLGYERPTMLRAQKARVAAVVVPELQNPVFPSFAETIGGILAQRGVIPVLFVTETGGMPEADCVEMLLDMRMSGVIFVSGLHAMEKHDYSHYRRLQERRLPLVTVNGIVEELKLPCVSADDQRAVELAMRHLVSLGHRRIGLAVSDVEHVPAARKIAAFEHAVGEMPNNDGEGPRLVERSMYSLEGGTAAATRLINRGATAVICGSDMMALGAVRAAQRLGLTVPEDISVVGYDDSPFMAVVTPPMTTIRQPVEAMGRAAVSLLLGQMAGSSARDEEILFEPELVVRGTTGPVRV